MRSGSLIEEAITLMTRSPVTCAPDDGVQRVLELMDRHHIRHVPVLDGATLIGVISAPDIVRLQLNGTIAQRQVQGQVQGQIRPPAEPPVYAH